MTRNAHETPYYPVHADVTPGQRGITVWDHYVESAMQGFLASGNTIRGSMLVADGNTILGRMGKLAASYAHDTLTANGWITPLTPEEETE